MQQDVQLEHAHESQLRNAFKNKAFSNIVEEKDVSLSHLQKQKTCENGGSGAALHTWPACKQLER